MMHKPRLYVLHEGKIIFFGELDKQQGKSSTSEIDLKGRVISCKDEDEEEQQAQCVYETHIVSVSVQSKFCHFTEAQKILDLISNQTLRMNRL